MGKTNTTDHSSGGQHSASTSMLLLTIGDTTWRMFVPAVGGTLLGVWLDGRFGTSPWLMFAGIIVGAIGAILLVREQLQKVKGAQVFATFASTSGLHISPKADTIMTIAGIDFTNSNLLGVLGLVLLMWLLVRTAAVARGRKKANFATRLTTWVFEGLYNSVHEIIPDAKWARRIAPLSITIFFFVVAQYWLGLLPVVGPITIGDEGAPLLRGAVADLSMTTALAIVTIVAAQFYAIRYLGFRGNLQRYFINPFKSPIMSFVGILELIAEFSRLLGLSFRLFGNVLAGEILLVMIAYLSSYLAPLTLQPFYIFELFIGGIQAYIFFMLTTVFISLGLTHHDESHDDAHSPAALQPQTAET